MKKLLFIACIVLGFVHHEDPTFKSEQLKNYRVYTSFEKQWDGIVHLLDSVGVDTNHVDVFLRAFKFEEELEVWVKHTDSSKYKLLTSYPFCEYVGALGPKREEGDKQIPEGYYHINKFNPNSAFYLSMKINYPNKSDSLLGTSEDWGGQIFIHGACATVGCIPITDLWISQLYVLCVQAKNSGSDIPVHIYPAKLNAENYALILDQVSDSARLSLWSQFKMGFDDFEEDHELSTVGIDDFGNYFFD